MLQKFFSEEYNDYIYINMLEVVAIVNGRIYLKNGSNIKLAADKNEYSLNQPIKPVYVPYIYPYQTIDPVYSQPTVPIYSPYFHNQFDKSTFNPFLFPTITVSK